MIYLLVSSSAARLLGLLEDFDQAPALGSAEWTGLVDQNEVADTGRVLLVVRLDLGGAADDLAVQRVLNAILDLDNDGLLHLVARDVTATDLAVSARALVLDVVGAVLVSGGGRRSGLSRSLRLCWCLYLSHYLASLVAFALGADFGSAATGASSAASSATGASS